MAAIVENITGNKALQLGNEEFVRKLSYGNNWNYLRIGCRVSLNGAATINPVRLQLGLCNGDTDTWSSSNCAGYVAACCGPITNVGGVFLNWDGTNYRYSGPGVNSSGFTKKIGSTVTDAQGGTNGTFFYIASSTGGSNPSILLADLNRTASDSVYLRWHVVTAAQLALTPSWYDLLRTIEDINLTGYGATYATYLTGYTHSGLPSNLDTLSVYWNWSTPTIEIADLTVLRFY